MKAEIEQLNRQYDTSIHIRIGISTGPVIAGVIGRKKVAYDLWGDTVNLACRLESHGESGTIQITRNTFDLVRDEFNCESQGDHQGERRGLNGGLACDRPEGGSAGRRGQQVKLRRGIGTSRRMTGGDLRLINPQCPLYVCAVRRRRFPVGASPTRQTLQPEATGAVMEVTKWLKPSV